MWDVFSLTIPANLGMAWEHIALFVITLSLLVFFAVDFRIGAIMEMLASALLFVWFYNVNLNYTPSLIAFFMWLVILSLTIYAVAKTGTRPQGAFI